MSKFESDEFKALQKLWYEKLSTTPDDTGEVFKDIEDTTRDGRPLKDWHHLRFKTSKRLSDRVAIESYYEQAQQLLSSFKFKNPTHYKIWELHCQGLSRRKIAGLIKDMTPNYNQARIGEIVLEIARAFKGESDAGSSS